MIAANDRGDALFDIIVERMCGMIRSGAFPNWQYLPDLVKTVNLLASTETPDHPDSAIPDLWRYCRRRAEQAALHAIATCAWQQAVEQARRNYAANP
jgi:hypothetical protein